MLCNRIAGDRGLELAQKLALRLLKNNNPYPRGPGGLYSGPGGGAGTPTGDDPRYTSPKRAREIEAEIKENIQRGHNAMQTAKTGVDVLNAMHRAEVGDIDFIWSRKIGTPPNEKERGTKHIIDRRNEQDEKRPGMNKLSVDELLDKLVVAVARGHANDTGNGWKIDYEGVRAILSKSRRKQNAWMISGFEKWPKEEGAR